MNKLSKRIAICFSILLCSGFSIFAQGGAEKNANEIKIACIQDTTGMTSSLGKMVEAGAQYAFDKINAENYIDGKTVKLVTYDTKGDVNEAINAFTRAVSSDKVTAIIGPPIANIDLAIAPISEKYDVPFLNLGIDTKCQMKADGTPYKNMFGFQPSALSQGAIMAKYSIEEEHNSTFGVIYNESNAYSISLKDSFINQVNKSGKTIVKKVNFSGNDTDFKTLLNDIVTANVDAIFVPCYTQKAILITQQARALGFDGDLIFGLDACPPFNNLLGEPADGIYFINNYDNTNPVIQNIIAEVKENMDIDVTNKFFLGYDIAYACAQAINEVGTDSAAIRDYIENLKDFEGLTGSITMNPETHFPIGLKMVMYTYEGSTPVLLQSYTADEMK